MRAEERAAKERAAQEKAAQEQERARAAAAAMAAAQEVAPRAELVNKVMIGAEIGLMIVGGVCIVKGAAGLWSDAACAATVGAPTYRGAASPAGNGPAPAAWTSATRLCTPKRR